jgi:putative component of membrane protein insertase Oxa1/YidC/SpoIIIJ protein YidD
MSLSQSFAITLVRVYQRVKPFVDAMYMSIFGVVSPCKHAPSCSAFTIEAIRDHGTIAGLILGGKRILSCR